VTDEGTDRDIRNLNAQNALAHKLDKKECRPIMTSGDTIEVDGPPTTADPREPLISLFRDLRTSALGWADSDSSRR
jgi:hypothetical protein